MTSAIKPYGKWSFCEFVLNNPVEGINSILFIFQEAENARVNLFELRAITAAVESSGQKKAEAQVS